ncbi:hypothetical protein PSHT_12578 [Puccinia striiformis]|uniref:Uncharacterized protein n=1 Tax=Puccinia striiformis TaxID=27350 RepID=A0A2S4UVT0_9BASI|nr:hypothetical protein PSHT_12578 [Puccinia striiformis]
MSKGDSLVDFAKFMMGCHGGNFPLPPEPTIEEVHARNQYDVATQPIPLDTQPIPLDYHRSELLSHPKFTSIAKHQCDHDFSSHGFNRITFEWKKPNWTDSDWNSCTADILCDNWGIWVLNEKKVSTFTYLEAKAALQEWLVSRNADLTQTRKQMQEGLDVVDRDFELMDGRHTAYYKKVAESRYRTALSIFPDRQEFFAFLQDPDTVSDYEESEDITVLPLRIVPLWRSSVLSALVQEIDQATVQLSAREKRTGILKWLSRSGERHVTEDENPYQRIPIGLPAYAYAAAFVEQKSFLERAQLKICIRKNDHPFALHDVLEHVKKMTHKPASNLPLE